MNTAKLIIDEKEYELPLVEGTEGTRAMDISKLQRTTGCITLDKGYANTGSTRSAITFVDGEKGILRYRGYPVEVIAERCDFTETAYLLIYGELPSPETRGVRKNVRVHTLLHEGMKQIFAGFPPDAHPMAILSSVVRRWRFSARTRSIRVARNSGAGDIPDAGENAHHRRVRL